jgi:hypothetical protein
MALTSIEQVRLKISDKPHLTREVTEGTGVDKYFKLGNAPALATPAPEVRVDGALKTENVDYTVNYEQGIITMTAVPTTGAELDFIYYWVVFTDEEIEQFISDANDNLVVAAAYGLFAWAADAAKVAKRYTLSGGGGLGQVVGDTSVTAKELRETAKALIDMEKDLGEAQPADGLTEVPWNEFQYLDSREQSIIRSS